MRLAYTERGSLSVILAESRACIHSWSTRGRRSGDGHVTVTYIQWNPCNADTLRNKRSVLIIGLSAFQRYGLYAHTLKKSSSKHEKYQNKTNL